MDQPGKVASPARGQLNSNYKYVFMQFLFIIGVPCTRFYDLYDDRRLSGMHVTLRSTSYLKLLCTAVLLLLLRYGKLYIHTMMLNAKFEYV